MFAVAEAEAVVAVLVIAEEQWGSRKKEGDAGLDCQENLCAN
jgi:hypothetical protein